MARGLGLAGSARSGHGPTLAARCQGVALCSHHTDSTRQSQFGFMIYVMCRGAQLGYNRAIVVSLPHLAGPSAAENGCFGLRFCFAPSGWAATMGDGGGVLVTA